MSVPQDAVCPTCGKEPTPESRARGRLSDLGYLHTDYRLECSAEHEWTVGVPRGETENDTWVCDACGGDFIPHFAYVHIEDMEFHVRPKCEQCNWVPDVPIVIDMQNPGNSDGRVFFGHHAITGDRDEAEAVTYS